MPARGWRSGRGPRECAAGTSSPRGRSATPRGPGEGVPVCGHLLRADRLPREPPLGSESPAQAGPSPAAAAKAWGLPGTVGCSRLCPPSSPVAASLPPEQPRRGGLPVSWCVANPRAVSQQHRGARPPHLCPWQCEPGGEGRRGSLVCPGPRLGGSRILERSCVTPAALCGPVTALGRVREPGLSARACLPEATRGS